MSAMRFARSLLGLDDRAEAPVSPGAAGRRNMLLLIQLRWLAVIGQVITIGVVRLGLGIEIPVEPMLVVLAALAVFDDASWPQRLQQLRTISVLGQRALERWDEAVAALARQLALQSQLIARDGDLWHLRVDSSSLNQTGSRDRLRAALEAAGHARQLHVELGPVTDTPARRLAFEKKTHQLLAEDIVKSNSLVQTLRRDFGAKIVPGSVKPLSIQPE